MMDFLNNCPVCNSNQVSNFIRCKDFVASFEEFDIYECKNCTHKFTNPRPSAQNIHKYYDSDIYVSHSGKEKHSMGFTYKMYDIIRSINIHLKLKIIKKFHKKGKLLDLGCGLGYFLNGVKKDMTFEPTGVDISEDAIDYIKTNFDNLNVYDETYIDSVEANSFDIITQWHVIEHVFDLKLRLSQLKRILHENGTMFIAVPNSASWDSKFYKNYWDGYDVPRHIHHFTRESFIKLFEDNGFDIIKIKPMIFDAPYICMRSEQHKKNSFTFLRGAFFGILSTFSATFSGQHSSLMFIVKHR